jgi:hypothetical protein
LPSGAGLGLGSGDQSSKGQLSTSNKFSATDRLNMKPYSTTQGFNSKDINDGGADF